MSEYERKTVRLHRAGGSTTVTIPKSWLARMAVADHVDLTRTEDGIMVTAHREAVRSIEDEPTFPHFLEFMTQAALSHPETLANAADVMGEDNELFAGVELDLDGAMALPSTATPTR